MLAVLTNSVASAAIDLAKDSLTGGNSGLDVIEATLNKVEMDPNVLHVGIGGWPNALGVMEFDGAMMDGTTRQIGCVAALTVTPRAASVARKLLDWGLHTTLVGEGADRFARENGLIDSSLLSPQAREDYVEWRAKHFGNQDLSTLDLSKELPRIFGFETQGEKDTAVVLVLTDQSSLDVGTSTTGWAFKYPGRVGDSPMAGGGYYAKSGVGAAACTHTGENAYRAMTAISVVHGLEAGLDLQAACERAADAMLALTGGVLGPVVIHAIDAKGEALALGVRFPDSEEMPHYGFWRENMSSPEMRPVLRYAPKN